MHDEIIKYTIEGELLDSKMSQIKDSLIGFLETRMREEGIVPSLDLDPQFTLDFDPDRDVFKFVLTVYGVYLGGERAWQEAGVMNGMTITRSILPSKLKES
jgi:hypothetical protein